jgi:hypothetical protein
MRIPGPSRRLRLCLAWVLAPMSPSWPRALHPAWWALVVGLHELRWVTAQSFSNRQPEPEMGVRGIRTAAAGPGGGATLGWGASVAPPLIFPPSEAGTRADIVADLGAPRPSVLLTQHQPLSALQPAATANSPVPPARVRVVLLPHARTEPTDTRANNRRAERDEDIKQGDSSQQHSTQHDGAPRVIAANGQWHDAELAMTVARHSFERWLVADHEDTPSSAIMHAHHTHTALCEAARAITLLTSTFRAEATTLN